MVGVLVGTGVWARAGATAQVAKRSAEERIAQDRTGEDGIGKEEGDGAAGRFKVVLPALI